MNKVNRDPQQNSDVDGNPVLYQIVELNPFRAIGMEIKLKVGCSKEQNVFGRPADMKTGNTNTFITHVKLCSQFRTGRHEEAEFYKKYARYRLTRDTPYYGNFINQDSPEWFVFPVEAYKKMVLEERFLDIRHLPKANIDKILPGIDKFELYENEKELLSLMKAVYKKAPNKTRKSSNKQKEFIAKEREENVKKLIDKEKGLFE